MDATTLAKPLLGGLLVGVAAAALLHFNGRILGVSGIVGRLIDGPHEDRGFRAWFLGGVLAGALALLAWSPGAFGASKATLPVLALAGLLVGFGTRLANGCTSGHGVCGIGRLSPRSIVATVTFIAVGMSAVVVARKLGAGW
ncbi:MAG: YeeE/YedE family protein [Deltaproteobacteria bacterium]|nr:YeeE/YedE family protein [Deltaproteobacteria bacterium]